MQKRYLEIGIGGILLILPLFIQAQRGPNVVEPEKSTKLVRGCLYEVVPGLAEITKIEVDKTADESLLHYNEHKVLFQFTPMGNTELLPCLKEHDLEFTLRSNVTKIPVGPQYIQQKGIKVGTKYAMNILQIKDKNACLEQYTYESKALDNDLFEAKAQIIPFVKGSYSEATLNKTAVNLENCLSAERLEDVHLTDDLGVSEDSLRAIIRMEFATKQQKRKFVSKNPKSISKSYESKAILIKKAKKNAVEKRKQERLVKRTALVEKKKRIEKLKALRAKLELEIELETQD
jgi:hypothetical protein